MNIYKASKFERHEVLSQSLADFITMKTMDPAMSKTAAKEVETLRKAYYTTQPPYNSVFASIHFRALVQDAARETDNKKANEKRAKVAAYINQKKQMMPYLTMGLYCHEVGNKAEANMAIMKDTRPELKIEMLINIGSFKEAAEETQKYSVKQPDIAEQYFAQIIQLSGGPGGLGDKFVKDARMKKR